MDKQTRAEETVAYKELKKLLKHGWLKIPTNIHKCQGLTREDFPYYDEADVFHPSQEGWSTAKCGMYKYPLENIKHVIWHEVVELSEMDNKGQALASSALYIVKGKETNTRILGRPSALLARLTEWDS